MAKQSRQQNTDITELLLEKGSKFSFYQALRLIKNTLGSKIPEHEISRYINVHPKLSLDFPASDIISINKNEQEVFEVTATFLGLYGVSSPLPTFYTENLLREQSDDYSLNREFIDIFNNHLYQLLFKIWSSYNLGYKIFEENDKDYVSYLLSIGGLNNNSNNIIPAECNPLRYVGILNHYPRSANGLKTFLSDVLHINQIEILECRETIIEIPDDQRFSLGLNNSSLGEDTHLGDSILSSTHAFTIQLGPLKYDAYHQIMPNTSKFNLLAKIVEVYIDQPLIWDIKVKVIGEEVPGITLGNPNGSQLGLDTWLVDNEIPREYIYSVNFQHS